MRLGCAFLSTLAVALLPTCAWAQAERRVTLDEVLREARLVAPDLVVARAQEQVAHAEVAVAGVYPNPSASVGTSTQAAKLSGTLSIPLVVLGQRGAAIDAAKADEATVKLDTQVAWNDIRQAAVRAYITLWLAEGVADARRQSAAIEATLEQSVIQRVQVGSAPELDALRVHAEKLRADDDVLEATAQVTASGSELGRWMGIHDGGGLRAGGNVEAPDVAPTLPLLLARLDGNASVRREQSDARAADARVDRERALVRPSLGLDVGADLWDPTLLPPGATGTPPVNYRAALTFDIPLFNQRGGYIDREKAQGDVARARVQAARVQAAAELTAAYRTFEAATARQRTLVDAVVPASEAAAKATEEAYTLGRAQLVAVLDA
ncbi:MAG TPA: TolC family protein [Polyangiaceae bacterium]